MDFSIMSTESCRYLLATSSVFEPYIPASHHDILSALSMLGQLGHLTQIHLQEAQARAIEAEKAAALVEAQAQIQAQKTQNPTPNTQSNSDQNLVQALLKLRNSDTFQRRGYRNSSNIIRQTPWNPQ